MPTHHRYDNVTVLIAEDDDGHAELIQELLAEVGVRNPVRRFRDGQELLDFMGGATPENSLQSGESYLLLLDIRMPRADGIDVLRFMKADERLKRIPIIMLTTTDDPREVQTCYELGCNCYITKPIEFEQFTAVLRNLGLFLMIVQVPAVQD